ncbi:hypothetical protein E2C01_078888 [Portunus trituberculatus]|uniref:Uncharacterized protein n=1 Tax=Portunus trituberculatus TaxID=210409 RepID=A0A5B7II05_PORTR|nr:hypothetical protein [Portunus trituberculatus]
MVREGSRGRRDHTDCTSLPRSFASRHQEPDKATIVPQSGVQIQADSEACVVLSPSPPTHLHAPPTPPPRR